MVAASIRSKNPGAMWGRTGARPSADKFVATNAKIPLKWGSSRTEYLNDGFGQGNNIAYFDTWVDGICAQIDLWKNSANYHNKRFEDAIATWSGHNSVAQYIAYVKKRVPGLTNDTVMDDAFWRSTMAIPFLKAQAAHEAGVTNYPAPDEDWETALAKVLGEKVKPPVKLEGQLIVPGDTGPGVEVMQRLLGCKVLGVYKPNSETEFALKLYQIRNALDPDGKCGSKTWAQLKGTTA